MRKNYRNIVWSVGILDKVILRWRRKRSGLRGFKPEPIAEGSSTTEAKPSKEEDDDFFKVGRKQTEQRLQKALARVKSMVQYPEARDQYRRLLNVVNGMQESKVHFVRMSPLLQRSFLCLSGWMRALFNISNASIFFFFFFQNS